MGREGWGGEGRVGREGEGKGKGEGGKGREGKGEGRRNVPANKNLRLHPCPPLVKRVWAAGVKANSHGRLLRPFSPFTWWDGFRDFFGYLALNYHDKINLNCLSQRQRHCGNGLGYLVLMIFVLVGKNK